MRGPRKARIQGQGGRYSVLALSTAAFNLIAQSDKSAVTREGKSVTRPVARGAGAAAPRIPGDRSPGHTSSRQSPHSCSWSHGKYGFSLHPGVA